MDITVRIPDEKIAADLRGYVEGLLSGPSYSGAKGSEAWQTVKSIAREQVAAIDWVPLVQQAIRASLAEIVADAVRAEIKRQATAQAKLVLAGAPD